MAEKAAVKAINLERQGRYGLLSQFRLLALD
jgi:hypothetical protein